MQAEFAEIQEVLRIEKENSNQGWTVLVKTPGNRKRMLLIVLTCFFSQCSGNGLVSYYLHDILDSVGVTSSYNQALINGGLQLWSFFVAVGMALTVERIFGVPAAWTLGVLHTNAERRRPPGQMSSSTRRCYR